MVALGDFVINKLSLKNFKGIKSLDDLDIKPITIFCGSNSSGKSSILQAILLLKQTMMNASTERTVIFNGKYAHLGSYNEVVYGKNPANNISISLTLNDEGIIDNDYGLGLSVAFWVQQIAGLGFNLDDAVLHYGIELENLNKNDGADFIDTAKDIVVKTMNFSIKSADNLLEIILQRKSDAKYHAVFKNIPRYLSRTKDKGDRISRGSCDITLSFIGARPYVALGVTSEERHVSGLEDLRIIVNYIGQMLQGLLNSYNYIGPLRYEPQRRYVVEEDFKEIGVKGENAPYILLSERDKQINNSIRIEGNRFVKCEQSSLIDSMNFWLDRMGINAFDNIYSGELLKLVMKSPSGTLVNISDVGFGVSQIFPIILEGLRMPEGSTLILEQPEIHLHPGLQMHLADFLISLALSGKSVIVETHSDHLINRMVRRIVEDDSTSIKDITSIYFAENVKNNVEYQKIKIDEEFGVVNWPKGFFDQNVSEQEIILKTGIKKRQKRRGVDVRG